MTQEHYQVPPQDVAQYWHLFNPLIQKAIDKSGNTDFTLDGIFNRLITNVWQLFIVLKDGELSLIYVTQVISFDSYNVLNVVFISSVDTKKIDMKYLQKALEETAGIFNCRKIIGGGRKAWLKAGKKFGYKDVTYMEKEL